MVQRLWKAGGIISRSKVNTILSLAFFFGWMLSFPFNGPTLFLFLAGRSYSGVSPGLVFIFFHAIGLLAAGLLLKKTNAWKKLMITGGSFCCLLYSSLFLFSNFSLPIIMAILGFSAGVFVIGWSFPYTVNITGSNRIKIMSVIIISAAIIYYVLNIMSTFIPANIVFVLTGLLPIFAIISTIRLKTSEDEFTMSFASEYFPQKLILLLGLLIFSLNINRGLLYTVIYPSQSDYERISLFFRQIPYIIVLSIMYFFFGSLKSKILPVYLSTSFMGFAFITFMFFRNSLSGYFIVEICIQFSFAFLDLFLWTILGDIAENSSHTYTIFAIGLFANVLAVFIGGIIGDYILKMQSSFHVLTPLLALTAIFITFLITPFLNYHLEKDLHGKLYSTLGLNSKDLEVDQTEKLLLDSNEEAASTREENIAEFFNDNNRYNMTFNYSILTSRENEIVSLILNGNTNREIAIRLFISENTVKTHMRHIYRKLGVAGKTGLLSYALESQLQFNQNK